MPLFPDQASTAAPRVDALYFFLLALSAFFATIIFTLVIAFAVKYRRPGGAPPPGVPVTDFLILEVTWIVLPLILSLVLFFWGAKLHIEMSEAPPRALDVSVVGKQWMWKLQHIDGKREINELHVPLGRPVKLTMISEDVIHSFFVPAFRVKADVLPGRYTSLWFEATRPGEYHLFCAEYCGTRHARMKGRVVVMEPAAYSQWLAGGHASERPAAAGERLFRALGCEGCHNPASGSRGPHLADLIGKEVRLRDGRTVVADENYVRESIVDPTAKLVAGFEPLMPTNYRDLAREEGILQLIAYIRSLSKEAKEEGRP
ncbi:MAG TPA: cytochrome c oxidase subunit II [Planctomycetota bacterium]|nr:cytochrome c oxidase subunit II [Planctomycetota bacterium]